MARKVKKRKIKILPLLILIIVILGIVLTCKFFLDRPISNIVVKNTTYLRDDYILELGGIKDYPSFLLTSSSKVEKKIKKSPYINKVNVKRKLNRSMIIDIDENRPVIYDIYNKNVVFNNNSSINMDDGNMVFVTLTKFSKINYYDNIVVQLEGHKGILYLDNGNHFEIKE